MMQGWTVYQDDFTFKETQSMYDNSEVYDITDQFQLAVKVMNTTNNTLPGDMSQYIATVYMQIG